MKNNCIDIPELNISVEKEVHDKGKSWDELGLDYNRKYLLTAEECIWLANSKYAKILKMDGNSSQDDFFIQQPFNKNKDFDYIAGFCAYSGGANLDCGGDSAYSNSGLGVSFKKKLLGKASPKEAFRKSFKERVKVCGFGVTHLFFPRLLGLHPLK